MWGGGGGGGGRFDDTCIIMVIIIVFADLAHNTMSGVLSAFARLPLLSTAQSLLSSTSRRTERWWELWLEHSSMTPSSSLRLIRQPSSAMANKKHDYKGGCDIKSRIFVCTTMHHKVIIRCRLQSSSALYTMMYLLVSVALCVSPATS